MDERRCDECGETLAECTCPEPPPVLIEGQEELFPVADPPPAQVGRPDWG